MKKRLSRLLLITVLLVVVTTILLMFLLVWKQKPEQVPFFLEIVGTSLLLALPVSVMLAILLAKYETNKISDALNEMDLEKPEQAILDQELAPLVKKIQKQNDVIADQMKQIREESENRESLRREFTANVSHEMKTPLTTISGTAEILRSGLVKPEDVAHFADNIYKESQRMTTLVNDIIRLSQLEEETPAVRKEQVDLYRITQETLSWLQEAAQKKQVTLSLTGTRSMVLGVENILSEMIFNLVDNAIKYNRTGGWVKVTVRDTGGQVRLTVTDTGIGIPKEHQERVFERFYRVDKSHSREIGGTGLGLSIVKHGAQFHDATIKLESEPDIGTTITLEF